MCIALITVVALSEFTNIFLLSSWRTKTELLLQPTDVFEISWLIFIVFFHSVAMFSTSFSFAVFTVFAVLQLFCICICCIFLCCIKEILSKTTRSTTKFKHNNNENGRFEKMFLSRQTDSWPNVSLH